MASPVPPSSSPAAPPPQPPQAEYPLPSNVKNVLKVLLNGSAKRKATMGGGDENETSTARRDYFDYGRAFTRLGEPFASICDVVERGLESENQDSDDEADISNDIRDKHLLCDWKILCRIIPGFRDQIIFLAEQQKLRYGVCTQINIGAEKARGDDTGNLKKDILGYLHKDISIPLNPLIHPNDPNKSLRGWRHQATARLMTPVELEANDVTFADVTAGRIKVTANQLPRFLYPDDHQYDPENVEDGLFHGHLMLRVAQHIYRGPKSVFQPPGYRRGGRPPISQIIKMHKMTPRSLAYIAVQARFSISDVQEWHTIDRDFRYELFFWNLVDLLDSEEGEEILLFYDREVLGLQADEQANSAASQLSQPPSTIELIKKQRIEKRARLDAAATL